jgi:hypothetical protein
LILLIVIRSHCIHIYPPSSSFPFRFCVDTSRRFDFIPGPNTHTRFPHTYMPTLRCCFLIHFFHSLILILFFRWLLRRWHAATSTQSEPRRTGTRGRARRYTQEYRTTVEVGGVLREVRGTGGAGGLGTGRRWIEGCDGNE